MPAKRCNRFFLVLLFFPVLLSAQSPKDFPRDDCYHYHEYSIIYKREKDSRGNYHQSDYRLVNSIRQDTMLLNFDFPEAMYQLSGPFILVFYKAPNPNNMEHQRQALMSLDGKILLNNFSFIIPKAV